MKPTRLFSVFAYVALAALLLSGCAADATRTAPAPTPRPQAASASSPSPVTEAERPDDSSTSSYARKLTRAKIVRVVDGDTALVSLTDGEVERVRFIGVDTPESTTRNEPYGAEAAAYTKRMLRTDQTVFLETDAERRDKYDRLLAYVWVNQPTTFDQGGTPTYTEARKKLFNAWLVRDGYAQIMTIPPNVRYQDYFLRLQRSAREEERGLWNPGLVARSSANVSKTATGGYIGNRNSMKFHRATCVWVGRMNPENKVPIKTRSAAISAGYIPCKVCRP